MEEIRAERIQRKKEHIGALYTHREYLESRFETADRNKQIHLKILISRVDILIKTEENFLTTL